MPDATLDQEEQELRMTQMRVDIEHKLLQIKLENRRFMVQAIGAAAALLIAGVALGRFLLFHQ